MKEFGTNRKLEIDNVFLSIGSNKGDKILFLNKAKDLIELKIGKISKISKIYETEPWGRKNQNNFLNQVIKLKTYHDPISLLRECKNIELEIGRSNSKKWDQREIDIDILYYSDIIIREKNLKIPHQHLHKRKFVLFPLKDIDDNFIHPQIKKNTSEILLGCEDTCQIKIYGN